MQTDILIVGSGCAGLYCALNLPKDKNILMITKDIVEHSDSYLAQGGMCMLKDPDDFDSYFYDTMKAGHFENDTAAVETMIKESPDLVKDLLSYGVDFQRDEDGNLAYTREGAHARNRIVYHEDITGKEITSHLYEQCKKLDNLTIKEHWTMVDLLTKDNCCYGVVVRKDDVPVAHNYENLSVPRPALCFRMPDIMSHETYYPIQIPDHYVPSTHETLSGIQFLPVPQSAPEWLFSLPTWHTNLPSQIVSHKYHSDLPWKIRSHVRLCSV